VGCGRVIVLCHAPEFVYTQIGIVPAANSGGGTALADTALPQASAAPRATAQAL